MSFEPASTVLSNVTVLDLTRVRVRSDRVRQLADWGADVIKIELPAALRQDGGWAARARVRLPEPAPQQARHDAEPEGPRTASSSSGWSRRPTWWSRTTART